MNTWTWNRGDTYFRVEYIPQETKDGGILTWTEEVAPENDDRGNGISLSSTQTHADFLKKGPHSGPPATIVEELLAHFQVVKPPLWLAPYRILMTARSNDAAAVEELLAQGFPSDTPFNGSTPLAEAVRYQNLPLAESLFARGVDINRRFPGMDDTILMQLASYAPNADWEPLAARIIAQSDDLEVRNKWGETALMKAASAGYRLPGLVPLLLQAGANVNARSIHGYTALMNSVDRRKAPVAVTLQLLAAGADVNALDNEGWSALMRAISNSIVPCVRCLLAAGADVHAVSAPKQKYREPQSVLQLAIAYDDPEIIALLQEAIA